MSKQKSKQVTEAEKNYYKLNTKAVERLATANKENAAKVSDEELKKFSRGGLEAIPVWIKALFIKFWFAGAACFFFYWGLGVYIPNQLDLQVVLALALGFVTDLLTNNVFRFIQSSDREYDKYMMFPSKKYVFLFLNVIYAFVLMFFVVMIYSGINYGLIVAADLPKDSVPLGVEPVLFGIFYTAVDMVFLTIKNKIAGALKKNQE